MKSRAAGCPARICPVCWIGLELGLTRKESFGRIMLGVMDCPCQVIRIANATTLVSALLKAPVKHKLAMTGEITLRGRVLPIGGLTEKLLAAKRGNITDVLIPKENERNLHDVPANILKSLNISLVDHMDEVLEHAIIVKEGETLFKGGAGGAVFGANTVPELTTRQ